MRIEAIETVCADGNHNAFTDLARFQGAYYLAFRSCPDGHMIFSTSEIVILRSADAVTWRECARFRVPGGDLRDPHFLATEGRLFVYSGCWPVTEGAPTHKRHNEMHSYVIYTDDGASWSGPQVAVGSAGCYFWRTGYWNGTCYITAKRRTPDLVGDKPDDRQRFQSVLFSSNDGLNWVETSVIVPEYGDETALLFEPDGLLVAFARHRLKERAARWCKSPPPYRDWETRSVTHNIGGPLFTKIGKNYLVAGRRIRTGERAVTALYWLRDGDLHELAVLPSHGDNSYPGFAQTGRSEGTLSYYSNRGNDRPGKPPSDILLVRLRWDALV